MNIRKLVTLAILSAIGVVLMCYVEIQYFIPHLKLEFSDICVLIALMLLGWKESLVVIVLKTLGDLAFTGISGPFAIGQISAMMASVSYVIGFSVFNRLLALSFELKRLVVLSITVVFVTLVMTITNYLFVTPIYLGASSVFSLSDWSMLGAGDNYLWLIISIYVPFNLLKGLSVVSLFYFVLSTIGNTNMFNLDEDVKDY